MSIPHTWIYLIFDPYTELTKIGKSDNPQKRLKELRSTPTILAAPTNYSLIEAWMGPESIERDLHEEYADDRMRGEWFDLSEQQRNDIQIKMAWFQRYKEKHAYAYELFKDMHDQKFKATLENKRLKRQIDSLLEQRFFLVKQRDSLITFAESGEFDAGQIAIEYVQ
jgi:hypothetical protein